jgi:hypothetical protein
MRALLFLIAESAKLCGAVLFSESLGTKAGNLLVHMFSLHVPDTDLVFIGIADDESALCKVLKGVRAVVVTGRLGALLAAATRCRIEHLVLLSSVGTAGFSLEVGVEILIQFANQMLYLIPACLKIDAKVRQKAM